jgi:hypothetical protein
MFSIVGASEKELSTVEQSSYDGIDEVLELSTDAIDFILDLDEINIKVLSYVKHHFNIDGLNWNEGFKNSAKGIEGIKYLDKNHGIGLTYLTFRNSFDVRTSAGGFVYKYTTDEIVKDFRSNIKLYALYQKGYYGSWDNPSGFSDGNSDNKFWTPLVSVGFDYKNFTIDVVGTHNTLHAITFGYSFKL